MGALEIQDAVMDGWSRYQEWEREFISDFQESFMKGQLRQAWAMMPPEMKELLKQQDPQGYEYVTTMLEGDEYNG